MTELLGFLKNSAALIVSVCALALTTTQIILTRRHNRLTVQPHLATFVSTGLDPNDNTIVIIKVTLQNNGLGPAMIKKFEVLLDGKPVSVSEPGDLYALAAKTLSGQLVPARCQFAVLRNHHVMAKDTDLDIAVIAIKGATPEQLAEVKRFHLRIIYASAYRNTFTYDSRMHKDDV